MSLLAFGLEEEKPERPKETVNPRPKPQVPEQTGNNAPFVEQHLARYCFFYKNGGDCHFLQSTDESCIGHPCYNWRSFDKDLLTRYGIRSIRMDYFDLKERRGKRR
ncbi:MAG TPA: hypothetical protein VMW26_06525 [Methanomassiliicoccales archaeon]|nr:hypothetical protein [Methanomassiliicoccales archaeon]